MIEPGYDATVLSSETGLYFPMRKRKSHLVDRERMDHAHLSTPLRAYTHQDKRKEEASLTTKQGRGKGVKTIRNTAVSGKKGEN